MSTRLAIFLIGLAAAPIARADAPPPADARPTTPASAEAAPTATPAEPARPLRAQPSIPDAAVQIRLPVAREPAPPARRARRRAEGPLALGLGAGLLWRNEPAHRVFTDRAYTPGVEAFARYDLAAPLPRTILAAGASLRSEQLGDDGFSVRHHAVQAELTARYGALSWLWPELRAGVGVVTSRFRMTELRGDDLDYRDRDTHVVGSLGGGITLRTPAHLLETPRGRLSSLSLGVLLDGGYTFAKDATLTATPSGDGEVPRSAFALGGLKRSGAYFRSMLVVRF